MNLANKVTISRILLVPIFLIALLIKIKYKDIEVGKYLAAIIFIIAASTDFIDGYIARKMHQITNLGKFLDPLADKLLVVAALVWLVEVHEMPSWMAIIIIAREFIVTGVRLVAAGEGIVIAASMWGKIKTITQIIAIIAILIHDLQPFAQLFVFPFHVIAMWIAVIATVYSGYDYVYKNKDIIIREV
ncbi:MAG: CDP-diacylglycerol--glycerol-3-phosphate 3-phosphatidyltransferase [Deltaproteobacteria bacterium]